MSAEQPHWYDFPEIDWETLFHPSFSYEFFRDPLVFPDPDHLSGSTDLCTPLTAAWVADAAMLAYGGIGNSHIDLLDFDDLMDRAQLRGHRVGNWSPDAKSVKAFLAYNQRFAILTFRGTKSVNWMNSAVDLAAFPARESLLSSDAEAPMGFEGDKDKDEEHDSRILVHAGFQFALNTLWPDISSCLESYRKKYPLSPVIFAGHSLGAAFATLAIARFKGRRAALYTFGSPRVGNKAFCDWVREHAELGIFRFVNNRDLMTTMPPKEKCYEHTCGLMHIGPEGRVDADPQVEEPVSAGFGRLLHEATSAIRDYMAHHPPPPELMDHAQRRYCYYLWRWAHDGRIP